MKIWIEIRFDNCQSYNSKIELEAVDLKLLKVYAADFIRNIEKLQDTINSMVQESKAKETEQ